jgi:hypothetical protein
VGFVSWFAQIPLIGPASRFVGRTTQTAGATATAAAAAAVIAVAGITIPGVVDHASTDTEMTAPATAEQILDVAPPDDGPASRRVRVLSQSGAGTVGADTSSGEAAVEGSGITEISEGAGIADDAEEAEADQGREQVWDDTSEDDRTLLEAIVDTVEQTADDIIPSAGIKP